MLIKWMIALTAISSIYSSNLLALGLGRVTLHSSLSQPLDATIDLVNTATLAPSQITPLLGSAKDFKRVGIERPDYLTLLNFKTIDHNGKPQIRVTSSQPIKEPFVNFLLEVRWPKGRILREYTVLLDPPAFGARTVEHSLTQPIPDITNLLKENTTYEVKANDSLWDIARRFSANDSVTTEKMMKALQKMNPDAFMQGDPDKLKKNIILNIPTVDEVAVLTKNVDLHRKPLSNMGEEQRVDSIIERKDQLKSLANENIKLVHQLKSLEKQIDTLETLVTSKAPEKTIYEKPESTRLSELTKNDKLAIKHNEATKPDKLIESVNNSLAPSSITLSEGNNHKPVIISDKIETKREPVWADRVLDNLYSLSLLLGGLLLMLGLGWWVYKRRQEKKEEEEMNAVLQAEAEAEEQNTVKKKSSDFEPEEGAVKFSELVTAREQSPVEDIAKETNQPDSLADPDEEVKALDEADEKQTLSLDMDEPLNKSNSESVVKDNSNDLSLAIDSQASVSEQLTETPKPEELLPNEENDSKIDIATQLEELDEELNALSGDLSLSDDLEEGSENDLNTSQALENENTSAASLLDLARAYLEMGDSDEAKEILNKVISEGSEMEKGEAEGLLKRCE